VQRFTYDAAGNLTSATDANGHVTTFRYGTCQRLLERVDAAGGVTRFKWGTEPGRLLRVVNAAGETNEFAYNAVGRITGERAFDGSERSFALDAAGFTVSATNANGQVVRMTRDALHRIVALELPDGARLEYAFDRSGHLVAAIDPAMPVTFDRDALGRVVREVQGDEWVESRYDAMGHLAVVTTSRGHIAETDVDANGYLTSLRTAGLPAIEWERNAYGQETSRRAERGFVLDQRYDALGRLAEQTVRPAAAGVRRAGMPSARYRRARVHRTFAYDPLGAPTSVVDEAWGRTDYAYAAVQRLEHATRAPGRSEQFAYDLAGNTTQVRAWEGEAAIVDDVLRYASGGRLLERGGTRHVYDAEGRRTVTVPDVNAGGERAWRYEWDALDRLTGVTTPAGEVWKYRYDALGRRVEKVGPMSRHRFIWDKDVIVHEVGAAGDVATWVFDTTTLAPLATIQNGELYSVVTDHLGTPRELLTIAGEVAWSARLLSWGSALEVERRTGAPPDCPFRFQGQYQDAETRLCYNRFRYYDPDNGQYLSRDPLGLAGHNPTLYSYVGNVNLWIDPYGLVCWSTARKNFWKKEAKQNPQQYSAANLARMKDGKAPKMTVEVVNNKTGEITTKDVSLELHHASIPQRQGGANVHDPSNLAIVTPWQHEAVDPFRNTGSTLLNVVKGVDSW
jgi:RHS repeat-associated protein